MRRRAPAALLAAVLTCAAAPGVAGAAQAEEEYWTPYSATIDHAQAGEMAAIGVDVGHTGFRGDRTHAQPITVELLPSQAARLERKGLELNEIEIARQAPKALRETGGDSPSPYYDVYRQYMGQGGILEEMQRLAAENRDIVKPMIVGRSLLGKPIIVLKMTADARNVKDGTRPAVFYSSVNHAREWIAAEMNRRLPIWFAENKDDPEVRQLLETRELWFMPVQNPDGYDYTFTCGQGAANALCGPGEASSNRFWRKTLRDNNANGIFGDAFDGVDPNRNYPAKRGIDEEGATNDVRGQTYRGPHALSEPENLAFDRLLRKIDFVANVNYHSAAQLLLTPVSYITDYAPVDATIFNAMTGVDGDSAVEPYIPERSSDLYESNGDTIDNGYLNYGVIGWTPELDTCSTAGGPLGCNQFDFPDDEGKVQAIFEKNLPMALNIAHSAEEIDRPRNFENDPTEYQVKPTQDIQVNQFGVSYGANQTIEAITRRSLGPADVVITASDPDGTTRRMPVTRMEEAPAGERYGDAPGVYFKRVRAQVPAEFVAIRNNDGDVVRAARPVGAGEILNVAVRAGGLQRRFSYRVEALPDAGTASAGRVLVVAAEDYTGVSPNLTPGYAAAPRYLDAHVASLEAAGYEVETFDVDAPPLDAAGAAGTKHPHALGVLAHFDAVLWYSGDDFIPQDATEANPRRLATATQQSGSQRLASWAHKTMISVRDYLNEGGKAVVAGRNIHMWPTSQNGLPRADRPNDPTFPSDGAVGPYQWAPDQVPGFYYPPNNAGDDDLPGTAFQRYRGISNDTWQNYLGVMGRERTSGYGTTGFNEANAQAIDGGIFAGMSAIDIDTAAGNDPNQDAAGATAPRTKSPVVLRTWAPDDDAWEPDDGQEPLRQETVQLAMDGQRADQPGGAAMSTQDTVTFGFGLEQVDGETRDELVARSMAHLLPEGPDTTAPSPVRFKMPNEAAPPATPRDPVEVDVTAADDSGDMREVRLLADGELVGRNPTFPFQFRWTPSASDVGTTVTLTAEAEDRAGNVSTATLAVPVQAAAADVEAPLPTGRPTLTGASTVGSTLTCLPGGFLNDPTAFRYEWLRDGAVVQDGAQSGYALTAADLGSLVQCRVTASNAAGDADAASVGKTVSAAAVGPAGPRGPRGPAVQPSPAAPAVTVACRTRHHRKRITCMVRTTSSTRERVDATVRVKGTRLAKSRTGRNGAVKVSLRSPRKFSRSRRVVVRVVTDNGRAKRTVRLNRRTQVALRALR